VTHDRVAITVLAGLVPLHIATLQANPARLRAARRDIDGCIDVITAAGQHLQEGNWRLTQRGTVVRYTKRDHAERRQALTALARALAVCALTRPAGVTFAGLHWCSNPGCADPGAEHPQPASPITVLPDLSRWAPPAPTTDPKENPI
jgi:hypothetical protein